MTVVTCIMVFFINLDMSINEIQSKWNEYNSKIINYCGIITTVVKKDGKISMNSRNTFKKNGRNIMTVIVDRISGEEKVYSSNEYYWFILARKSSNAEWKVIQTSRQSVKFDKDTLRVLTESDAVKRGGLLVYNNNINDIIMNNNTRTKLHSGLLSIAVGDRAYNIKNADIVLDDKPPYLIKSYTADISTVSASGRVKCSNEYWDGILDRTPKSISEEHEILVGGKPMNISVLREYSRPDSTNVDVSEFYLSSFGLKEPVWMNSNNTSSISVVPWYVFISILGIILIIVSTAFQYIKKKPR